MEAFIDMCIVYTLASFHSDIEKRNGIVLVFTFGQPNSHISRGETYVRKILKKMDACGPWKVGCRAEYAKE